jgi:hypothetical protein
MFYKTYKLLTVIVFHLILGTIQAQETIPAAGGNISGDGGSVDFTVGQIVYTSNSGLNGTIEEGVQQPYEIWTYTGMEEAKGIQLECSVFPNPVNDILTLKVDIQKKDKLSYRLYEMNGKLIENNKITSVETSISMKDLAAGTFFLKVICNNKELKNFKIIKH